MNERQVFEQALDIHNPAERAAFLDRACADQADLRRQVEQLLKAHEQAGEFLDQPHPAAGAVEHTGPYVSQSQPAEKPGMVIAGKYKLLQRIGEGGMGSVWMADQLEPVKRRVAVKLIRADRDGSRTILSRFEAERQAIALMDHPHIAKLLDAGTTGDSSPLAPREESLQRAGPPLAEREGYLGRPYFVMELVKGVPLTAFCDEHKLSVPDRLNLFMQICSAVQHAHQKGIIHRDLKPTNILVEMHDDKPVPKVIDFGLAKAMSGQPLTEHTLFTGFGTVAGTPLYMAPEQAKFNAIDIDTRADIYALGVILYELLTGSTPIERASLKKAALDEILRVIRESEPPTPSKRLSSTESKPTVAANRKSEPAKLGRFVRGELDWIVMKALSKERDRRYETANGFARDVERFLNHEPVVAGPPTVRYKLRKFVTRNKAQVVAGSLILLALLLGVTGTTVGLIRAETRRREAEQARSEEAEQRALAVAEQKKAEDAEAQTLADYRASTDDAIEQLIGSKPELGAQEKAYLEQTLKRWQAFADRKGDDERSRAIRAEGHHRVAGLWKKLGRRDAARIGFERARELLQALADQFPAVPEYRDDLATIHNHLGSLLRALGSHDEARVQYEQARDLLRQLAEQFPAVPVYRQGLATTHMNLGNLLAVLGKRDQARAEFERARELQRQLAEQFPAVPAYEQELARTHTNLGILLDELGERDAARTETERARDLQQALAERLPGVPAYQEELARTHNHLGVRFKNLNRPSEARAEYERARDLQRRLADQFPAMPVYRQELARTHYNLGHLLADLRRRDEARAEYERARDLQRSLADLFPAEPEYRQELARTHNNLGVLLAGLGRRDDARAEYETACDLQRQLADKFPAVRSYQVELGGSYGNYGAWVRDGGKPEESLVWFEKAIRTLTAVYDREPRDVDAKRFLRNIHRDRALALGRLTRYTEALADWAKAIDLSPMAEQSRFRAERAMARNRAGQVAEAVAEVAELTTSSHWDAVQWYYFSRICAVASGKTAAKKQEYADRAMELLHKAVKGGFKDAARMKKDTDLDPLRNRDDFKKLLTELEAKAKE